MTNRQFWMGILVAAGVLLATASARAADCHFDRTLGVGATGMLSAGTGSGDLKIVPGDGSHVHIIGHVKSSNSGWFGGSGQQADVQRICDHPPIQQNGSEIRIGAQGSSEWFHHVSIDYFIEVPHSFNVNASSGSGDVELHNLGGGVTGTTGSGNLHASNLGAGARLETGSGDIVGEALSGDTKLGTGSGSIQVSFNNAGAVRASTGSGDIHLDNLVGALVAHTGSGNVEASGRPRAGWQIGTGSGTVKLHVPNGSGFTLDANVSSGDIQTNLPITMQGGITKHHVRGAVGGGGPEVHVESSSGDIRID